MANEKSCACASDHLGACESSLAGSTSPDAQKPTGSAPETYPEWEDRQLRDKLALTLLERGTPPEKCFLVADAMMLDRAGSPASARLAELECDACHIDYCTRPGHRLHALGLAGSTSPPDEARPTATAVYLANTRPKPGSGS